MPESRKHIIPKIQKNIFGVVSQAIMEIEEKGKSDEFIKNEI